MWCARYPSQVSIGSVRGRWETRLWLCRNYWKYPNEYRIPSSSSPSPGEYLAAHLEAANQAPRRRIWGDESRTSSADRGTKSPSALRWFFWYRFSLNWMGFALGFRSRCVIVLDSIRFDCVVVCFLDSTGLFCLCSKLHWRMPRVRDNACILEPWWISGFICFVWSYRVPYLCFFGSVWSENCYEH